MRRRLNEQRYTYTIDKDDVVEALEKVGIRVDDIWIPRDYGDDNFFEFTTSSPCYLEGVMLWAEDVNNVRVGFTTTVDQDKGNDKLTEFLKRFKKANFAITNTYRR